MKRIWLVISILFLFIGLNSVKAYETTKRVIIKSENGKNANVREKPSTSSKVLDYAGLDGIYNLVTDEKFKDEENYKACKDDWYLIYYNGTSKGYLCGENALVVESYRTDDAIATTTCEIEMANLGFPSSYWGELCYLKEKHPSWTFTALKTNLDWKDAIEGESVCGKNKIYKENDNLAFVDSSCTEGDAGGYVSVMPSALVYYMDPRNWLAERTIFQFLHLAYNETFAPIYQDASYSIIKDAMFYLYHKNNGIDMTELINNVGHTLNVSPIFTSARILQELGSKDSLINLYSGTYVAPINSYTDLDKKNLMIERFGSDGKKYYGYYNFYNFGVNDVCVANYGTTYCGLSYAAKESINWNTVEKAIEGGIRQLAVNYLQKNQATTYLQKFNVIETEGRSLYSHQYMSNVAGPSSESITTYNTYKKLDILDKNLIFYIPIYNNMDAPIDNVGNGASGDSGVDTGPSSIPIPTIITSSGYRTSGSYLLGIELGSNVANLKANIEAVGGNSTVVITDANGNTVNEGIMKTGYKVTINNQSTKETLEVVIKGDTSGDGLVNALDLLQVQKNILGTYILQGAYEIAGDTSGDVVINALDLLQVQKSILGTYKISQ